MDHQKDGKGDEFRGQIFAKFPNPETVDKVAATIEKSKPTISGREVKCKPDREINIRAPLSLLLGLRWQLTEWGWSKKEVKVKDEEMLMKVGGVPVVQASVVDFKVVLIWFDDTWKQWRELQDSSELTQLIATANDKLAKSAASQTKGKGKGPQGS